MLSVLLIFVELMLTIGESTAFSKERTPSLDIIPFDTLCKNSTVLLYNEEEYNVEWGIPVIKILPCVLEGFICLIALLGMLREPIGLDEVSYENVKEKESWIVKEDVTGWIECKRLMSTHVDGFDTHLLSIQRYGDVGSGHIE